ncbi:MAG: type I-E CRISPR-associated protein Cas5/CasD [Bryobacteraceae bacterium]|nr:MAG: type I-E CRISPR-associated protein Cas5/CasD [Bryobacteraceae bacterium]
MSETAHLALLFDAPMQSWGVSSKFQNRGTLPHPTRSAILGLFCAAAGAAKGSREEKELLEALAGARITTVEIPRRAADGERRVPIRRLRDFHTVLGTRTADGKPNANAVVTLRDYLTDARFGVVVSGPNELVTRLQRWLEDPVWGVWFGRKCCLPAAPIVRGVFGSREEALLHLTEGREIRLFTRVEDVDRFDEGTDSLCDVPLSFGTPDSSSEGRVFAYRRIRVSPAEAE